MSEGIVNDILNEAVQSADESGPDPSKLSLEALILLINTERLKSIQDKTVKELKELKERQSTVAQLHKLLKAINAATDADGKLDYSKDEELKALIQQAKELGVDVKDDKFSYNKDERERLVDNVRMTIEDLNIQNDMQLQTVSRLTSERYESYQMARSILKPLHEAKLAHARGVKG